MDESNAIRAITIGVSTFIAIITISAVMMYYSTAKNTVQEIGSGPDLYNNYASYIRDILLKPSGSIITGAEAVNLINYFYNDETVEINSKENGPLVYDEINEKTHLDSSFKKINLNNEKYNQSINQICVVQNIKITQKDNNGKLTITLESAN